MRDFFESKKFKVLLAVAIFIAGIMAYAGANGRLTAAPQEILGVALYPFQWVSAHVSESINHTWEKYHRFDEVQQENEVLREENKALKDKQVAYDRMQAELNAYKELEEIQEQNPENTYASAFIIGRDTMDMFGGFTVDIGTLQGVEKGDVVVSDDGYLVGIVREANLASCKIMTVLHPSFAAASAISRTRDNGIVAGSADYAAEGLCLMSNLPRRNDIEKDDLVITTGLGGVFPQDMLIGTVHELLPEVSGKSLQAVVKPGVDILSLTHVFVLTDE